MPRVYGDIDGLHLELVKRLYRAAQLCGRDIYVNSGVRTIAEQQRLYDAYLRYQRGGPYAPVAAKPTTCLAGGSWHICKCAGDCEMDGPTSQVMPRNVPAVRDAFNRAGLSFTVASEPWHVQPTGFTKTMALAGPYFSGTEYRGDTAPYTPPTFDTRVIQREMTALGYGTLVEDGEYGPATKAAVLACQRDYNQHRGEDPVVTEDGQYGPLTSQFAVFWAYHRGVWPDGWPGGRWTPAFTGTWTAMPREAVVTLQRQLWDLHLHAGDWALGFPVKSRDQFVDGGYGPATKRAVYRLQQMYNVRSGAQDIPADGLYGPASTKAMAWAYAQATLGCDPYPGEVPAPQDPPPADAPDTLILGIDVSHHQGAIDWFAVRQHGVGFAIIKATEGATYEDPQFQRNILGATTAQIPVVGVYHFLRRDTDTQAQVDNLRRALKGRLGGLIVALDVETAGDGSEPGIDKVRDFVAKWNASTGGYPLVLYTGRWYWEDHIGNPDARDLGLPLWHSRYIKHPGAELDTMYREVPASYWTVAFGGWTEPTILQFTSSAKVPGIAGNVDGNAVRGGRLRTLTR